MIVLGCVQQHGIARFLQLPEHLASVALTYDVAIEAPSIAFSGQDIQPRIRAAVQFDLQPTHWIARLAIRLLDFLKTSHQEPSSVVVLRKPET